MEALANKYLLSGKLEIFQVVPQMLLSFLPCVEIRGELFACGHFQNSNIYMFISSNVICNNRQLAHGVNGLVFSRALFSFSLTITGQHSASAASIFL